MIFLGLIRAGVLVFLALWQVLAMPSLSAAELPAFRLDATKVTVSGISSGAYMAVQFGTAFSASVSGVAATAGGPYFCAGRDAWAGGGVGKVMARCMQGDPAYPAQPITEADLDDMHAATLAWSARGLNDAASHLERQRIWLFHGYNDGIVKQPVSDALERWYEGFVPDTQLFYKQDLRAAHAQISASCAVDGDATCNPCAVTGGDFINACPGGATDGSSYDAAGAALQMFYGPMERTPSSGLTGTLVEFDQTPFIQRNGRPLIPQRASMAAAGYVYVPQACAAGEACRLHVAFHGCQQEAGRIGTRFVTRAGFNEWADANRIVVLYPQTAAVWAVPFTPFNPNGCWDWWGYTDFGFDMTGHYATRDGTQMAAVWRMVQRLAAAGQAGVPSPEGAVPVLKVIDRSPSQVVLAWTPVAGAVGYRIYRGEGERAGDGGPLRALTAVAVDGPSWVDSRDLSPQTTYRYLVRPVDRSGVEGLSSATVRVSTGRTPPACDPYYSLLQERVVGRNNRPANDVCP